MDKLLRIAGIGSISGFLQPECPTLVIGRVEIEEKFVTVLVPEKIRVVTERFIGAVVNSETLLAGIIIVAHGLAAPAVTFNSEVVVTLDGEYGITAV